MKMLTKYHTAAVSGYVRDEHHGLMTDCHPGSESYSSAAATDDKASRCYYQTVTQVRYL